MRGGFAGIGASVWAREVLGEWVIRGLTFLVISCPCALVISIPLSFFGGIGAAGSRGVLVKGSNYLEALSKTGIVVFDKTGTLTKGVFEVTGIYPATDKESYFGAFRNDDCHTAKKEDRDSEYSPEAELLKYAALAESFSDHPISKSLISSL